MKTGNVLTLASAWLVIGYAGPAFSEEAWNAPARQARKPNPVEPTPAALRDGGQLYAAACLPCHGAQGQGDGPVAGSMPKRPSDLSGALVREQTDGELFWKITNGRVPMPSFRDAFTEEQRWRLVHYVRSLDRSRPAAHEPAGEHNENRNRKR